MTQLLKNRVIQGMDIDLTPILAPFLDNPWVQVFTAVVTLASAISAVTATPKTGWPAKLYKILNVLSLNIGKAKQK